MESNSPMPSATTAIRLGVNGKVHRLDVDPRSTLLGLSANRCRRARLSYRQGDLNMQTFSYARAATLRDALRNALDIRFSQAKPGRHNGFKVDLARRAVIRALQTAGGVA